jgi:hypothetical protein
MEKTSKWFTEEQRLFAKNKALVDQAIQQAQLQQSGGNASGQSALTEISTLETELKKTIYHHSQLIAETTELSQTADQIISRAKLKKLRPVFDFNQSLSRLYREDRPQDMAFILMPLFAPKIVKTFSIQSIDNILTLKTDDRLKGEKVEKQEVDLDYIYEDEKLELQIGRNFAMLFTELLQRLAKWNRVTLKELNAILEIKFGEEIYENRDYFAFLTHLAGKDHYSMAHMRKKQDTMLEEMVVSNMPEEDQETYGTMAFDIQFGQEEIYIGPEGEQKQDAPEQDRSYITNMIFERSEE